MPTATAGNSLRIIGGRWRSRRISFPPVAGLRPTGDRIRETLFNWLQNIIPGAICLDLFAGSGACGMEALSRGASWVTFIENNPGAAAAIGQNLRLLQAEGYEVVATDALRWLESCNGGDGRKFDVVFIDPPFEQELWIPAATRLEQCGCLGNDARIYIESARALDIAQLPGNWSCLRQQQAGKVSYALFSRRQEH